MEIETDVAEAAMLTLADLDLKRISQRSQGEEVIRFPRQRAREKANCEGYSQYLKNFDYLYALA